MPVTSPAPDKLTREVAWNGIRFLCSTRWELSRIASDYLLLTDADGPLVELRWGQWPKKFDHTKALKKLTAGQSKPMRQSLKAWDLPASWQAALSTFDTSGFQWHHKGLNGRGVIAFCPDCRRITYLQFYHRRGPSPDRTTTTLLQSFSDHCRQAMQRWAVHDIGFNLPSDYQLQASHFEAGAFRLHWTHQDDHVKLYRWGPAVVYLQQTDMQQFAVDQWSDLAWAHARAEQLDSRTWQWLVHRQGSLWQWLRLPRRRTQPRFELARLAHRPANNRLIGLRLSSPQPLDSHFLDHLWQSYEIV